MGMTPAPNPRQHGHRAPNVLIKDVEKYWDERSAAYSAIVKDEMANAAMAAWQSVFQEKSADVLSASEHPVALDLGCGPGLFSILMAQLGFEVIAVDLSAGMLSQARANAIAAGVFDRISFIQGNVHDLPIADNSVDLVASRNVTWLMQDPMGAYREWLRVMKPSGKMLCFDANWHHYLVDSDLNALRAADQQDIHDSGITEEGLWTEEQNHRSELIALELPSTYTQRPGWDQCALKFLGFSQVDVDVNVYQRLWSEEEKSFYATSPLFLIEAVK